MPKIVNSEDSVGHICAQSQRSAARLCTDFWLPRLRVFNMTTSGIFENGLCLKQIS